MDYKQPDFYRFNEDSIQLVNFIKMNITKADHILDLGAGCGIIGIELARHFEPLSVDFVEAQSPFEQMIKENIEFFLKKISSKIYIEAFSRWNSEKKYDLIVSNPPYYLPGRGRASKDRRRQICRSFEIDNWNFLLEKIRYSLSSNGTGFIILKTDLFLMEQLREKVSQQELVMQVNEIKDLWILRLNKNRNEDFS